MDDDNISLISSYAPVPPSRFRRPEYTDIIPSAGFKVLLDQLTQNLDKIQIASSTLQTSQGTTKKCRNHHGRSRSTGTDTDTKDISRGTHSQSRNGGGPVSKSSKCNLHDTFTISHGSDFRSTKSRARENRKKTRRLPVRFHENSTLDSALHKLEHYHLNIRNLPFIASTKPLAPSFNLTANFQQVIGKLKTHHRDLCSSSHSHCNDYQIAEAYQPEKEYAELYRKYELLKLAIASSTSAARTDVLLDEKRSIKNRLREILTMMASRDPRSALMRSTHGQKISVDEKSPAPLHSSQELLRDLKNVQAIFDEYNQ